jgi:hypothetical protein
MTRKAGILLRAALYLDKDLIPNGDHLKQRILEKHFL